MDEGDLAKAPADRSIVGRWPPRWKVGPPVGPREIKLQHSSMKIQINALRDAGKMASWRGLCKVPACMVV